MAVLHDQCVLYCDNIKNCLKFHTHIIILKYHVYFNPYNGDVRVGTIFAKIITYITLYCNIYEYIDFDFLTLRLPST